MSKVFKKYVLVLTVVYGLFHMNGLVAQSSSPAVFEVGSATIDAHSTLQPFQQTPFTTIMFDGAFASAPNVFVVTPEFDGLDDPCNIRIRNITNSSFEAACIEPLSDNSAVSGNRANPDIPFEYIAVQNGTTNVPLASGAGSVSFQSGCSFITDQQGRGTNTSFADVDFSPAFNSPPAVLTQIQSTINSLQGSGTIPGGEPAFIDVAVRNVTANDVDIAIDVGETGVNLSNGETICYLATELSACQTLDFSSLGGPALIEFQALQSGAVIQGHDDGACDSVSFENGCFDSSPVVLAKQTTRNGPDGGYLRRCDITDSAATFVYDEEQINDAERSHSGAEAISILAFSETFTTPVTISSAKVSLLGRAATFTWETSAETFNLGFNLWGETSEGWVQLNNRLITGSSTDSGEARKYRQTRRLSRDQQREITQFGISSVDTTGYEEFYGPFSEGQEYGEEANNEPVDWTSTRNAFDEAMRERGFTRINNRWRRLSQYAEKLVEKRNLGIGRTVFDLNVESTGIHSISGAELIALNPSWNRVRLNRIALTLNGDAVPRHIVSSNNRLDANDRIIFNARDVTGDDTPFLENYTYRLLIDGSKSTDATRYDGTDTENQSATGYGLITKKLTSKKLHSASLTTGDPWYDTRLLSVGSPASADYSVNFDQPINEDLEGQVKVVVFGSLDLPGGEDDHHMQVFVNDELVHEVRFDGLLGYEQTVTLPAGIVKNTTNTVRITLTGDTGHFADLVLVDEIELSAFTSLSSEQTQVTDFAHNVDVSAYQLASSDPEALEVFAYTDGGLLSSVEASVNEQSIDFTGLPFQVSESNDTELRYAVAEGVNWPTPVISLTIGQDLHTQEADYVIVAHPSFMGDDLNGFAQFKADLGYKVRIVDWLEIVNTYGYGNNTPSALNNFLSEANELYSTDNILIVGGHTSDFFGITNDSIVNFIPAHYEPVDIFEYTATDNPYADLNGDNIPELAIGRWPVRSLADLQTIIKKTKDWHQNREDSPYQSAYLLAQDTDGQNLSFSEQLRNRVNTPLLNLEEIQAINQLYLDDLPEGVSDVVSFTRNELAAQINGGTDLISFAGHASPTAWGFQNIINTNFIQGLENQGEPVLLMPLACFITHYESVSTNTLAHQWLFAGDKGAAAIHGASVLGAFRENGLFAQRYLNNSKDSKTVGEAILKSKQALGSANEMQANWVMLGDPALPIR